MIYGHILRLREIMMIPEKVFPGLLVMTSGSASINYNQRKTYILTFL